MGDQHGLRRVPRVQGHETLMSPRKSLEERVVEFLDGHPLLAKWRLDKEGFLPARGFVWTAHTREVLWGLEVLFSEPYFGQRWYPSFAHGLYDKQQLTCDFDDFKRWVFLAALGHDLGKCSGEFQQMLVGMELAYRDFGGDPRGITNPKVMQERMDKLKRHRQVYRHEFLSALLMYHQPDIRAWFREAAGSETGYTYALAGAFGHHLKASDWKALRAARMVAEIQNRDKRFRVLPVYTDKLSTDVNEVLTQHVPSTFDSGWAPFPAVPRYDFGNSFVASGKLQQRLDDLKVDPLFQGINDDATSAAIKWLVIMSDTYGSVHHTGDSVSQTRDRLLRSIQATWGAVKVDYAARINRRLAGNPLKPAQRAARAPHKNLIAQGSTGSGKTLTAFNWAASRPNVLLIFCAHTTDAATCFYNDYGDMAQDWLRHSKAWFDIEFRTTHGENTASKAGSATPDDEEQAEGIEMIDVLRGFDKDVTFTTADQVLGIVAFYRKSVMWLPVLLKSQVVFDEVASYDPMMLAWLRRFHEWFPLVPVAQMSATIPDKLLTELTALSHRPNPSRPLSTAPRLVRDSRRNGADRMRPRYRVHVVDAPVDVASYFVKGTLWFVNVVSRAQDLAREFPDAIAYHSRFKNEDRTAIRDQLVKAFDADQPQRVERVIATQAAEMALDISARGTISELCPPASAIQRMGRGNRRGEFGIIDVYFYMPPADNGLPYVPVRDWEPVYKKWADWLRAFGNQPVSQDMLEREFQRFYADPANHGRDRSAHTTLLQTYRNSVRHAIYTTPCLLAADLAINPKMDAKDVLRHKVPVLLRPKDKKWLRDAGRMYDRVHILDTSFGTYDPRLGFCARKR